MRYLTYTASSCVSTWMSLARRWIAVVDHRIDQTNDRAQVAREPLDRQAALRLIVVGQYVELEAFRGLVRVLAAIPRSS